MLAVERLFDYMVPEPLAAVVGVGTIVRVNLGGRRVRAWVVEDGVESEAPPGKLRPVLAAVSAGPSPEVVALTAWAAHRFAGPRLPLLRAASPAAVVPPAPLPVISGTPGPERAPHGDAPPTGPASEAAAAGDQPGADAAARPGSAAAGELAADAAGHPVAVVRWPPAEDPGALIAGLLAPSGSTIVVVPEGRLGALAARLRATGATVVPWLTEGRPRDRARAWNRSRQGGCVVLGGRSAVLAPVPDLAAVLVVDDGSEALKEERSPTWHARDLAAERARRLGARLTTVSPVPPLEAPGPVLVPARAAERAGWPITEVIDRGREAPGLGLFSERAVAALRAAVSSRSGAVCVLNRKGRARLLACGACGDLGRCERCDAAVSELDPGPGAPGPGRMGAAGEAGSAPAGLPVRLLACGRCGTTRPRVCVSCGSTKLKVLRAGVTRVREELAALLPGVGVAMVEAATTELPSEPVLIGTEAVLHRVAPHPAGSVAVVVFLDFDAELLAPRFRAGEQALWLIVRAARLVGPRAAAGRILVQTRLPRHEVVEAAVRADPGLLAEAERPRRELLALPPFAALARVTGDPAALAAAAAALRSVGAGAGIGVSGGGVDLGHLSGDAGAFAGSRARDAVLVRAPSADALADALAIALAAGRPAGRLRAVVDPLRV